MYPQLRGYKGEEKLHMGGVPEQERLNTTAPEVMNSNHCAFEGYGDSNPVLLRIYLCSFLVC
jgi:hypothetical protein